MQGRIWFAGSPWPGGHAVAEFDWWGRIDPDGRLWFDLDLLSEDYDAGEPTVGGEDGDWHSPDAWRNYHRCHFRPARGLLAAEPGRPFRLTAPQRLTADPLAEVDLDLDDELAFHVYLLGHDSTAAHEVVFTPTATGHDITWAGALALTYAGDEEFRHRFRAQLRDVAPSRIALPEGTPARTAHEWLGQLIDAPDRFVLDPSGRWFTGPV